MPKKSHYTVEDMRAAVALSSSFAQVLARLGLRPAGGNYKYLKERLAAHAIDYSHFKHQGWSRQKVLGPKRVLADYLVFPSPARISSFALKGRLLREGLLESHCSACLLTIWKGEPIPLELDHINGNNQDNRLANLRLLCPNCHALTATYRGRNRRKH